MSDSKARRLLCLLLLTAVLNLTKFTDSLTPQRSFNGRIRTAMMKSEAGRRRRQMMSELEERKQLQDELEDWPAKRMHSERTLVPCTDVIPALTHNVSFGDWASAVTTFRDEVFAVKLSEAAVRVYDAATLTFKRSLSVPGLDRAFGLAASDRDNCLYVTGSGNGKVYKVQLPNGPVTMQWNVGDRPYGIAINRAQNSIVNLLNEYKIKEYTSNGSLVRQVSVPERFVLHDVVELPNGQLLVSNSVSSGNKLAAFDVEGTQVNSYAGDLLGYGTGFAVFENGYIIAADSWNNRMLIVNPTLTSAQVLPVSGLNEPFRVAIDESRGRVYIGECNVSEGRLVMLENVFGRCLVF